MSQAAADSLCSAVEGFFVMLLGSDEAKMTSWERENIEAPMAHLIQHHFPQHIDTIFAGSMYGRLGVAGGAYLLRMWSEMERKLRQEQDKREQARRTAGLPKGPRSAGGPPGPPPPPPPPSADGGSSGGVAFDFDAHPDWLKGAEGDEL